MSSILRALCLAAVTQLTSPPVNGPRDLIEQVAALGTARAAHTATVLTSGKVLVVGGMADGGGSLASAELFDPLSNSVQTIPALAESRVGHTATLLADGRVLIAGGYNGEYLASLEVFDPTSNRFRAAGSLTEGRSGHTATLMTDGRVLLTGGIGRGWTFLSSAEIYDPKSGRSRAVGRMHVAREGHIATLLEDGRVLVSGGHSGRRQNMEVHGTAEVFLPGSGRFEEAGTLLTARHKHDAVRLADGRVLIIGGADRTDRNYYATTETFNPHTMTFTHGPSMAHSRYKIAGTSVRLPDGSILVTSGARDAELLVITGWSFQKVPGRLPDAYRFATAVPLPGGDVMITGGYSDANRNTAGVWRFHR